MMETRHNVAKRAVMDVIRERWLIVLRCFRSDASRSLATYGAL